MRRNPLRRWHRVALLLVGLAAPAAAQNPESGLVVPPLTPAQEAEAHEAMTKLRSPVTPFHTVDMCPSVGALRDSIRVAAATGESADEIVEDVISRYGEQVRLLPKRSGAGLLAWIGTPLVLLAGAALIVARVRRGRAELDRFPAPAVEISDADRERLAAALRQYDEREEVGA